MGYNFFRVWGKIASIVALITLLVKSITILRSYRLEAFLSGWFWLLVAVELIPLSLITIPLTYLAWIKPKRI